ncbi:MAG TPA: energy transducer TonB [Bacteroidia bacterium]|jgi:protein TonB|nr:energy transducer TonB [Bacteroidia bacterium]
MNPFRSNVGTLNEILFENKNKSYGAYAIRSAYGNTVFKSLGITACIMFLFMGILVLLCSTNVIPEEVIPDTGTDSIITYSMDVTPKTKEEQTTHPESNAAAQQQNRQSVATVITDNNNQIDTTQTDPNAVVTTRGTGTLNVDPVNILPGTGTLTTTTTATTTTESGSSVFIPEEWPAFPNLKKFWADNIKYPREAIENDIQGKVGVNFIIDENGKVVEAKIINKLGYGCDEEVLRVIKLMLDWKPGKMGGKAVRVSFKQAVDFRLK